MQRTTQYIQHTNGVVVFTESTTTEKQVCKPVVVGPAKELKAAAFKTLAKKMKLEADVF